MSRVKTFDSTGIAPNGRMYAGDLNAIQDQYADLTNLLQAISVASIAVGEAGLAISRYGAGVMGIAGTLRVTNLINAIAGFQVNGVALASTHLSDSAGLARLASPVFTGTPTAPTPPVGDNSTTIATTAWVKAQGYSTSSGVVLTGDPQAPTPAVNDNDQSVATTAFVIGQLSATTPAMDGTGAVGVSLRGARADHVHPTDTSRAPLASPALTGAPTAPYPAGGVGDDSTAVATTAFVRDIVPAGVIMAFAGSAAPAGWLLCNGALVSRTTYAALFAAISTAYGAGDGSTTFGIPNLQGRVPVGKASTGTFAALGTTGGEETHTLVGTEMPSHTHIFSGSAMAGHAHTFTGSAMAGHAHTFTGSALAGHAHTFTGATLPAHAHWMTDRTYGPDVMASTSMHARDGTTTAIVDVGKGTGATVGANGYTYDVETGTTSDEAWPAVSGSINSVSAGTPAGTISSVSAGTPAGTINSVSAGTPAGTNANSGGDGAHNNLQPYQVVNYIIKT